MINEILDYIYKHNIVCVKEIEQKFNIDKNFIEYLIRFTNYNIEGKFIFYKKHNTKHICAQCHYKKYC